MNVEDEVRSIRAEVCAITEQKDLIVEYLALKKVSEHSVFVRETTHCLNVGETVDV